MAKRPRFSNQPVKNTSTKRPKIAESANAVPVESSADVAMHSAKLKEIERNLDLRNKIPKILIISGPPGASKSTAVRVLCSELNRPIHEFAISDLDREDSFGEFLSGCVYCPRDSVILVDELPNLVYPSTLEAFQQSLEYWLDEDASAQLVVLLTEVDFGTHYRDSLVATRVFSNILEKPNVVHIKCNPVNATQIKKALRDMGASGSLMSSLSSCGDIRYAVNTFRLWANADKSELSLRDEKSTIFHQLGQIVFTSENVGVKSIVDSAHDEAFNRHLFESYIGANYSRLCMRDLAKCCDWLSLCDVPTMEPLAAAGVFIGIAEGDVDTTQPKVFRPLTLSQKFKYTKEQAAFAEKIQTDFIELRGLVPTSLEDVLLQRSLGLQVPKPAIDLDLSDDDW